MAKPNHIILLRHGKSIGNEDRGVYANIPDFALTLTDEGKRQAQEAAIKLHRLLGNDEVMFYVSPFWRTRQTFEIVAKCFPRFQAREEPRLREQEWGHLRSREVIDCVEKQRDAYSSAYYRIPDGESVLDVYDRVSGFLDTLHRDFEKTDFPPNVIIVGHGMTNRVFLMRWLHYSIEQFELLANPRNCGYFDLRLQDGGKYALARKPRQYKKANHDHRYPGRIIAYPFIKSV